MEPVQDSESSQVIQLNKDVLNDDTVTHRDKDYNFSPETTKDTITPENVNTIKSPSCAVPSENTNSMISHLTNGFLSEVHPQLAEMRTQTKEICKSQCILIDSFKLENKKYEDNQDFEELTKMISSIQTYYTKLKRVKQDMDQMDERLRKLKKRSLKLKERREKQDKEEAERREKELVLERELMAKKTVK